MIKLGKLFGNTLEKLFTFDKNSNFFILMELGDKVCGFNIWNHSLKVRIFNYICNISLILHLAVLSYELFAVIRDNILIGIFIDKFHIYISIVFGYLRLVFLRYHKTNFENFSTFVNGQKFRPIERYSFSCRKKAYLMVNKFGIILQTLVFLLTIIWTKYFDNYIIDGNVEWYIQKGFYLVFFQWSFVYFKGIWINISILAAFIVEINVLKMSFRNIFDDVTKDPSISPSKKNQLVRSIFTENINYYIELLAHLKEMRKYFEIFFLSEIFVSVLHISITCFTIVGSHLLLSLIEITTLICVYGFELLAYCRLMDHLNEAVSIHSS